MDRATFVFNEGQIFQVMYLYQNNGIIQGREHHMGDEESTASQPLDGNTVNESLTR
jgi:hypothetical protein